MSNATAKGITIKCSREAETHSGPLHRVGDEWVCQQCFDKQHGIVRREVKGRPITCPKCGAVLMTKFRGGKINIGNIRMIGNKTILTCDCGYEKVIDNPFGGSKHGKEVALYNAKEMERKAKKESESGS